MPLRRLRLPELAKVKRQDPPSHTVRLSPSLTSLPHLVFSSHSTGEQPHACPDCDEYRTADPGSLTRHRKKVHGYVPKQKSKAQSTTTSKSHRHAPYDRPRGSSFTSSSSSSSRSSSYHTCDSNSPVFDLSPVSTPSPPSYPYTSAPTAPPSDSACSEKIDDALHPDLLYTYPWDKDFSVQRPVSPEAHFAALAANSVPGHLLTATGSNSQFEFDFAAGFFCDSNANVMSMPPPVEVVSDLTLDDALFFSQPAAVVPGAGCTVDVFSSPFDFGERGGGGALQGAGPCATVASSWMPNANVVMSSCQPVIDPGLYPRCGLESSLDQPTCISPAFLTVSSVTRYASSFEMPTDLLLDDLPRLDFSMLLPDPLTAGC